VEVRALSLRVVVRLEFYRCWRNNEFLFVAVIVLRLVMELRVETALGGVFVFFFCWRVLFDCFLLAIRISVEDSPISSGDYALGRLSPFGFPSSSQSLIFDIYLWSLWVDDCHNHLLVS